MRGVAGLGILVKRLLATRKIAMAIIVESFEDVPVGPNSPRKALLAQSRDVNRFQGR
jgi:hypothetical protein